MCTKEEQKEKKRNSSKVWYWKNREKSLQSSKEYYQKNKVAIKERAREYQQENKQKCTQAHNEWRRNNKAKNTEIQKRWRQKRAKQKRMENILKANQMFKDIKYVAFKDDKNIWILENGLVFHLNKFRYLKQQKSNNGRYLISINHNTYSLHRLIATAFDDRTKQYLDSFDCHHLDISAENNALDNLVFINSHLHDIMHKHLKKETIISIGAQVKHLRGSQKTNQFERLVKEQLANRITDIL